MSNSVTTTPSHATWKFHLTTNFANFIYEKGLPIKRSLYQSDLIKPINSTEQSRNFFLKCLNNIGYDTYIMVNAKGAEAHAWVIHIDVTKSGTKWVDLYDGDTKLGLSELPALTSFLSLRQIFIEEAHNPPKNFPSGIKPNHRRKNANPKQIVPINKIH